MTALSGERRDRCDGGIVTVVASCARITAQQCVPFCSDVFHSPRVPSVFSPLSGGLGRHCFPTPGEWKCSDL